MAETAPIHAARSSRYSLSEEQYNTLVGTTHRIVSFARLLADVLEKGPTIGVTKNHSDAFRYLLQIMANDAGSLEAVLNQTGLGRRDG